MAKLRENVIIITGTGTRLTGYLFVGANGLPELRLYVQLDNEHFTPATFPAAWTLRTTGEIGVLLIAWWAIQGIQEELRKAEREADAIAEQQAEWNRGRR